MKKCVIIVISYFLVLYTGFSQECKVYIPGTVGAQSELTMYDKKDKAKGVIKQELKSITQSGDSTIFTIHQQSFNDKGKELTQGDYRFKCVDNVFYIDMSTMFDKKALDAYKDMQMKMTSDNANIPSSLSEGQKLKDGFVKIEVQAGPMQMTFKIEITNRKVEKFESITTTAGTFKCVLISEDVNSQMGIGKINYHTKSWYSEKVGVVRSENYKQDNLESYMVLTAYKK